MTHLWRVRHRALLVLLAAVLPATVFAQSSASANASDTQCQGPPPAPTGLRATADPSGVRFSWDPSPGATSYQVQSVGGNRDSRQEGVPTIITEPYFAVAVMPEWIWVTLFVTARNDCGNSEWPWLSAPARLPYVPIELQAFPGRRSIQALWTPDPREDGTHVDGRVRVTVYPGGHYCEAFHGMRGCIVTGLTPGRRYRVSLEATSMLGNVPGPTLSRPVLVVTGPTAPRAVQVLTGISDARISWQPPRFDGGQPVIRYVVTTAPGGRVCTTTRLMCRIAGLESGRAYQFVVVADNGRAKGDPGVSPTVSTAIPAPQPGPVAPPPKPEAPLS